MTRYVALLRAVNVGGRSLPMAGLRAMIEDLGGKNPQTLLQSGNAVFAAATAAAALERRLEDEAQRRFGMPIAFLLRTAAEWDALVARNPFAEAARSDPAHLLLMALKAAPAPAAIAALRAAHQGRESIHVDGRDAYLVYPDGVGRSKLTNTLIERKLGVAGTARNWNTVLKLTALVAT